MAPRRGGGGSYSSGSSGSTVCPNCNEPIFISGYTFNDSYAVAALVFSFIALISFIILFLLSLRTQVRNVKGQQRTLGLKWVLLSITLYEALIIVDSFLLNLEGVQLTRSYYILGPFITFFGYVADTIIAYTIYTMIATRMAVNGATGRSKATRLIGIIGTTLLALLAIIAISMRITETVQEVNETYGSGGLYRALPAVGLAHTSLTFVLAIISFILSIMPFFGHRSSGLHSKIPLLTTISTPFWVIRSLITLAISASLYTGTYVGSYRTIGLVTEITYSILAAAVYAPLVVALWQREWADPSSYGQGVVYPKQNHAGDYTVRH